MTLAKKLEVKVVKTLWDKVMYLYGYLFLLYDGIGFFGFSMYKLARLRGEKPNLLTKF